MKPLITGGTGRLGKELVKVYPTALAPFHMDMDITNHAVVGKFFKKHKPDAVIHTAAFTNVVRAETEKEHTWNVNVMGTENIVDACLKNKPDCYLIYISTACVFYGDRGNYVETDIPHPKNFYGLTKLLGELVAKKLEKVLIIRTNFVAREKWPYEKAFTDRFGTYLFADDVAMAIRDVIRKELTGVVHICSTRKLSMFELAKITTPDIKPMTIAEYRGPPLTMDMSLASIRIKPYKMSI